MLAEFKLTVSGNSGIIETVTKQTGTQPAQLMKSVEEFQQLVNKALTKIIESSELSGGDCMDLEEEELDEDEADNDAEMTPRKKKK